MEPARYDNGEFLYGLLTMARNYRPNGNKDYFVPVDAAVAVILGRPLVADRLLGAALKSRCILNFKKDDYCRPHMEFSRGGKTVSWTYGVRSLSDEGRRVAWVPSQEYAASSGWKLTLTNYDNASVVSKDLMWLMLQCHKITRPPVGPPSLYSRAIMEYFTVSEVTDYVDPHGVLPDHMPWEVSGGIASVIKEKRYMAKSHDILVAAISNDSWWELYRRFLKTAVRGAFEINMAGCSNAKWFESTVSQLSKDHELRMLDIADYMGDEGLACGCAYSSRGPLLRAALARPDQKCTIDSYMLTTIIFRTDIDQDCESALIEYLGRCDKTELLHAVMNLLQQWYGTSPALRRLSVAAVRVLIGATRGLEITLQAYEYMDTLYISSGLLIYSTMSLHAPITEFAYTLSQTHKKVAQELSLAAETLCAAEIYTTREDAIQAVIDKLLVVCPRDQKELSRVLLWMMLRGADGQELLLAYVGHVSTTKRIRKAETDRYTMDLFGLRYRPWLSGKERIAES